MLISDLKKILKTHMKSEVALICGIEDTRTIDAWVARGAIPLKYHSKLKTILK